MNKKVQRVKALIIKEFYQIIRDPSSILIAIVFPILLLFIYGFGVSLDMKHLKLGLYCADSNPDIENFTLGLKNSTFFSVYQSDNQQELDQKLSRGELQGIVIIPFYFSEFQKSSSEKAPIYVIADGSSPNTATFVQNYVTGAWANYLEQQALSTRSKTKGFAVPVARYWYNEELDSRNFLIPGSIAIIMTLIGTLLTALVISREWERGTMEALMTTPMTLREFVFSKMVAYFCLGIFSMILCTFVAILLYGIPFRGSFGMLLIVSSVFLIAALGIGLLISSFAKDQFIAAQVAIMTSFLPAFMLSGFIFEISSMPLLIQLFTTIIPAKYMVSSLQTLFLAGNVTKLLWINILALSLIAAVPLAILTKKSKKTLES
jgi:ABC-2 type transport system permease protein